jgi:hypothetical protein
MNTTYAFKPGSHIRADANKAAEVCENLRKGGGLSPQSLLDASRPKDAVLHDEFEWDDSVAAEEYRLRQAGHIIRCIVVIHEKPTDGAKKEEVVPVRVYHPTHNTEDEKRGTYENITVIAKNTDMKARLMQDCLRELKWMQNKYSALKEVVNLLNPPILLLQQKIDTEDAG